MTRKVISMETKLAAIFSRDAAGLIPNVTALCAQLGISRQTYYKYRRRFEVEGLAGLTVKSTRPTTSPTATSPELVAAIIAARAALLAEGWDYGAISVRYRLLFEGLAAPASRTIHRVLTRNGLVEISPKKRPRSSLRRFEFPATDDCWQIDALEYALADGTIVAVFELIDDHSRYEVATLAWPTEDTAGAWECISRAMHTYGRPRMLLSDNGLAFTGKHMGFTVMFETNLSKLGVKTITSAPRHPQTCGKNERAHQTIRRWLAKQPTAGTLTELQEQLHRYRTGYNDRPHQALNGDTPRTRRTAGMRHQPTQAAIDPPTFVTTTRASKRGTIQAAATRIPLGVEFAKAPVTVFTTGTHVLVFQHDMLLRELTINPALRYQPLTRPDGRTKVKRGHLSAMS
jgi:transposase InsO family protein